MKNKDIIDALGMIDRDMIEDAERERKKAPGGAWVRVVAVAASIGIIAAIGITILISGLNKGDGGVPILPSKSENTEENTDTDTDTDTDTEKNELPENSIYWVDDRERNGKNAVGQDGGIVWPWELLAPYEKYDTLTYNGVEYRVRTNKGAGISPSMIGEKLGDAFCKGYDEYTDSANSIGCEVFAITKVSSDRFVAVKYSGDDKYYAFIKDAYNAPANLGELITLLNLKENIVFERLYHYVSASEWDKYGLNEAGSDEVWNVIEKYSATLCEKDSPIPQYGSKLLSFSLNSDALGSNNLSMSFTDKGYLVTNIENYGYYFCIGTDAVNEIIECALGNKTAPPPDEKQYLSGIITEIGDNYIKVDDSVLMQDPEDGIEFTVYADHVNIERYIKAGYLRVGQCVNIEHGPLKKENYTEIRNATDLEEAIITSTGDVIIPE